MILAFLFACTPDDVPPSTATLSVGAIPSVPTLTWAGDDGASVRVEGPESFTTAPGDPSDGLAILGLAPATDFELVPIDADGTVRRAVSFRTPDLPSGLSRIDAEDPDPQSLLDDGLIAMSVAAEEGSYLAMVDTDGVVRWWFPADYGMTVASPQVARDGSGFWLAQHEAAREVDLGVATFVSWDGRDRRDIRTPRAHHKVVELPDGRLAYLAHHAVEFVVEDTPRTVLSDRIEVVDPALVGASDPYASGELEPEVVFDFFDTTEPWSPCFHADRTIDKWDYTEVFEWTHSNSLVHDEDEGLYFLMSWHLDALLAIDDQSGEVRWQLGGRDATRSFVDPLADAFDHAHTAWVDGDSAWVFDNRVHDGTTSRLVRYDLTSDPVAVDRAIPEATGRNVGFLGDVQPGPGGHVLGGWTLPGDVTEHDDDGNELWRVTLGPGSVLGRFRYVERPW